MLTSRALTLKDSSTALALIDAPLARRVKFEDQIGVALSTALDHLAQMAEDAGRAALAAKLDRGHARLTGE